MKSSLSKAETKLDRATTNMHRLDFVLARRRPCARIFRRNKHWQRVYWKRLRTFHLANQ